VRAVLELTQGTAGVVMRHVPVVVDMDLRLVVVDVLGVTDDLLVR